MSIEREDEKITLAELKQKKEEDVVEDTANARINMKNYDSATTGLKYKMLNSYYCALCGALCLVTNVNLETLPTRFTDKSESFTYDRIAINLQDDFSKHYLKKGDVKYIRRLRGIEQQWRLTCECGVLVAYQAISFEESDRLMKKEANLNLSNKPYIYFLNDALVISTQLAKLVQEMSRINKEIE